MIAEIVFNLPLRRTFDYLLREEELEWISPGCRVIVPFGSRLLSGIVVGLKAKSALAPEKLKTLHQSAEGGILFSGELLDFTRWVGAYYFCGWGEVLEAAVPSGMGVKINTIYQVKAPPLPAEKLRGVSPPLVPFLDSGGEWSEAQWKRKKATPADFRWLWRNTRPGGAISVRFEYAGTRSQPRREKWVRLLETPPRPLKKRRNPRQETKKEIILRLLREEGELPMARLKSFMKTPGPVVKTLSGDGFVEMFEKRTVSRFKRNPRQEPFLKLNPDQEKALGAIVKAVGEEGYRAFLLEGVTGSGKTEVYLQAVRETEKLGKTSLILVPEIALTESIVNRFRSRFGDKVAVLHSGMGEGERFDEWRRVHQGEASIVIGARSAVFAPLQRLGLVVVDEEHDPSYKQDDSPRYHGWDAAMMRASKSGAVVVLGSATPSIESYHNVNQGKLVRLLLPVRIENRPLPQVEILDLKTQPRQKGSPLFSLYLIEALREVILKKEQAMLFLNRRGFAHLVRCKSCEEPLICPNCSITLTFHQTEKSLRCHRCDHSRAMPQLCPACEEPGIEVIGLGTERIEKELAVIFPQARILRMDSDSLRRRGELERMLAGIRNRDYDLIIGTQILSKGHDFPHITLVGAVMADVSLNMPDFRAGERTFQVLTQMAGRAGRGELPGRVLIQTYNPDHYSLAFVRNHDTRRFAEKEIAIRSDTKSPPWCSQALLWVNGPRPDRTKALAHNLARRLRSVNQGGVVILGAAEGPIKKISNRYRWMILLRAKTITPIHQLLWKVLENSDFKIGGKERVAVDIDPYNLM